MCDCQCKSKPITLSGTIRIPTGDVSDELRRQERIAALREV